MPMSFELSPVPGEQAVEQIFVLDLSKLFLKIFNINNTVKDKNTTFVIVFFVRFSFSVCVYWAVMMAVSPEPSCGHFALEALSHQPSSLPTSCLEYCSLDLSHTHTQPHTRSQRCQSLRMCVYISQHLWQQQPSGHSASSPKHLHAGTNNFQSSSEPASTYPSLLWRS